MLKIDIDFLGKYNIIPSVFAVLRGICVCVHTVQHILFCFQFISHLRACLKNHSSNLHAPICGTFCLHSVDVVCYAAPPFRQNLPQIVTESYRKHFSNTLKGKVRKNYEKTTETHQPIPYNSIHLVGSNAGGILSTGSQFSGYPDNTAKGKCGREYK